MFKINLATPSIILAIGLIFAPAAWAADNEKGLISVTGIGTVNAAPDMATINLTVLREAPTSREALSANNTAMNDVLSAMKEFGIEDKDLQTSNFSIHPRYVYPKNNNDQQQPPKIVAYQVSNSLAVRIRDLAGVGEILDKSVSLGVNQGGSIMFSNSNPEPLQMQARASAMKNALEKAKILTEAAGVEVGSIRQINEQSKSPYPQPIMRGQMAKMSMAESDAVPVAGGENSYRISVNVTFEIDQ